MGLLAISLGLIVLASIALVFGWATANAWLIWTCIVASVGAGVCLALAYVRARALGRTVGRRRPRRHRPRPSKG